VSMKFRKKPVVIEAMQYVGTNLLEVMAFIEGVNPDLRSAIAREKWCEYRDLVAENGLIIKTLEDGKNNQAKHVANNGDWIIKGIKGEFYPCKPEIFIATYDKVED